MVRARVVIEGRVQGVAFRASMVEEARLQGVAGWVKNNPDGTVEAVIEGKEVPVGRVLEWCRKGPPLARVDDVRLAWEPFKNEFDDFTALTRYSAY